MKNGPGVKVMRDNVVYGKTKGKINNDLQSGVKVMT